MVKLNFTSHFIRFALQIFHVETRPREPAVGAMRSLNRDLLKIAEYGKPCHVECWEAMARTWDEVDSVLVKPVRWV